MRARVFLKDEAGSVSILVAAMLVVLLGFAALAVDIGLATAEKRSVVTAADAAALAGAQELVFNPTAGPVKAIEYAVQKNGADADKVTAVVSEGNKAITVQAGKEVNYGFARVLGFESVTVSAQAKAIVGSIVGMRGVVPLAAPETDYQQGSLYELKLGQWKQGELGPGNFNAIAPGKPGASDYRTYMQQGYPGMIRFGDVIDTESGNMSGPTKDGVEYRIDLCRQNCNPGGCTWDNHSIHCPLLVYVPLYAPPDSLNKVKEVTIAGFAAFFLENETGNGSSSTVKGRFLRSVAFGEINPDLNGHGLYGVKLVE